MRSRGALSALALVVLVSVTACADPFTLISGKTIYDVTNETMEPTFKKGATVRMVLTENYRPKLGDVVLVHPPAAWDLGDHPILRRVLGVPGGTVRCCDDHGVLLVNGEPHEEPYLYPDPAFFMFDTVTLPPGRIWVMADNRGVAIDSRSYARIGKDGTVPVENVVGVLDGL